MSGALPVDHPTVLPARIGVLLVNLGTPDAPTPAAVRRYLAEFLSDPRVIEIPRLIWKPILHCIILRTRPRKSAHAYQQVWEGNWSPLARHTNATKTALERAWGDNVLVDWAMRYGNPSIRKGLQDFRAYGCDRILIAPLYPQYCAATTASVMDAVGDALKEMRWQPAIRTLPPYHDDPLYIETLANRIRAQLAGLPFEPDRLIASFHGMPARTLALGDPYHCQCLKTARLLGEALGRDVMVTFQSRFGRAKWLEPYTEPTLAALPGQGAKRIAIVTPGFSADCLETLEEIAIRAREVFLAAGGDAFAYLPCLNAEPDAIAFYRSLLGRELAGWLDDAASGRGGGIVSRRG